MYRFPAWAVWKNRHAVLKCLRDAEPWVFKSGEAIDGMYSAVPCKHGGSRLQKADPVTQRLIEFARKKRRYSSFTSLICQVQKNWPELSKK